MANASSSESKDQTTELPQPEELKPKDEQTPAAEATASSASSGKSKVGKRPRHLTYRPSHKATFIGLVVIAAILLINGAVIFFVIKSQSKSNSKNNQGQVTISQAALDKLGVNSSSVGDAGIELTVNPNARFDGNVQIGGNTSIAGKLQLSSKLSAGDASFTQLQAGNTSLSQLNVNGNGTLTNLNVRQDLVVDGLLQLKGAVTVSQLFTVDNSASVSGNMAVGGVLTANGFQTNDAVVSGSLTVGGHVITAGSAPSVSGGACGGVTNSGDDATGTIFIPVGAGGCSGTIATVHFRSAYGNIPHVVITPVDIGQGIPSGLTFYVGNLSASGFNINVSGRLTSSIDVDYMAEQ